MNGGQGSDAKTTALHYEFLFPLQLSARSRKCCFIFRHRRHMARRLWHYDNRPLACYSK